MSGGTGPAPENTEHRPGQAAAGGDFVGVRRVRIEGFRSIRDASFRPGALSALVGEASTGKSNVLAAIRAVLDPETATPVAADLPSGGDGTLRITAELADGSASSLTGTPPATVVRPGAAVPTVLFLPAHLRTGPVVAPSGRDGGPAASAIATLRRALPAAGAAAEAPRRRRGATEAARGLVAGLESWLEAGLSGVVLLVEEPELFLPPQTQRYLYRLLRLLTATGNQVIYTTHSPSFLNVARLDELVMIERLPRVGTRLLQPEALPADDEFRAYSEFDASRSELFLARAAVLVEGLTEQLALPFVFRAMGYDPDRERISIVECGGKPNIPLVAKIARTVSIPFIAVHDRDAPAGKSPSTAERRLNRLIDEIAGRDHRVELVPDFEGVAGLKGRRRKPARAWHIFATLERAEVPQPLVRIVERAVALARR